MSIKAFIGIVATSLLLTSVVGCAEIVETKTETSNVNIVGSEHTGSYGTIIRVGKYSIPINHSATYKVYVEYNGKTLNIDDEDIYNKFKDSIGEVVTGKIVTETYSDGYMRQKLEDLYK